MEPKPGTRLTGLFTGGGVASNFAVGTETGGNLLDAVSGEIDFGSDGLRTTDDGLTADFDGSMAEKIGSKTNVAMASSNVFFLTTRSVGQFGPRSVQPKIAGSKKTYTEYHNRKRAEALRQENRQEWLQLAFCTVRESRRLLRATVRSPRHGKSVNRGSVAPNP